MAGHAITVNIGLREACRAGHALHMQGANADARPIRAEHRKVSCAEPARWIGPITYMFCNATLHELCNPACYVESNCQS